MHITALEFLKIIKLFEFYCRVVDFYCQALEFCIAEHARARQSTPEHASARQSTVEHSREQLSTLSCYNIFSLVKTIF